MKRTDAQPWLLGGGPLPRVKSPPSLCPWSGVCPRCGPTLLAASPALQPPPSPGGSPTRGGLACSLPLPDSVASRSSAVAPSSLAAGCPPPQRGWGPLHRFPLSTDLNNPRAAPGGTPGATARVPDAALSILLVPALSLPASLTCHGANAGLPVSATPTALGCRSRPVAPVAGSRWPSPPASATPGFLD